MSDVKRWLWPALLLTVAVLMGVIYGWSASRNPIVQTDAALVDLPATTLDGVRLDAAYFGQRPWVILVWLPG